MDKVTPKQIMEALWRKGNLTYLLDKNQKVLYDIFKNSEAKKNVWLLARRSGKSYALAVFATELCLRNPMSVVKILAPTKDQIDRVLRPIFMKILKDCPEELLPSYSTGDLVYYFKNKSEIHLAGANSGHAERLRGSDSSLCIVDEAGTCSDLEYIVQDILIPSTLMTEGKVILASTPPKDTDHDFIKFIEEAEARGTLTKRTIYDNPRLTKQMLQSAILEAGGEHTDTFKREYLCEITRDKNITVIPELTPQLEARIVKEWPKPSHYKPYVGMDIGFKDYTGLVFAYHDFRHNKVIVEDEILVRGADLQIPTLTKDIIQKETTLWENALTREKLTPKRVSDINYIVTSEIRRESGNLIRFDNANKAEKEVAINNLRVLISQEKIIIHPRCTNLIRHLKNAKWTKGAKADFARDPDDGHYDLLPALVYLVRAIDFKHNPYPNNIDIPMDDLFIVDDVKFKQKYSRDSQMDMFKKIFNLRK